MADRGSDLPKRAPIRAEIAGNRLELIETGQERFRLLLDLIAGAKRSIKMLMYMFNPDRDGDAVRNALTDAARRGVEVKLLIDGFGSAATPDFFADLAEAGGHDCVFTFLRTSRLAGLSASTRWYSPSAWEKRRATK